MHRHPLRPLCPLRAAATHSRCLSTASAASLPAVSIVEVGPRDGLQNEKGTLSTQLKVDLIQNLVKVGLDTVEIGSLVSKKMVPQMASTPEVLAHPILGQLRHDQPSLSFPVLVPTAHHLGSLLAAPCQLKEPPLVDTVSVFLSASEAFSKANIGCSVADSVARARPVVEEALRNRLRVRGYLSVVLGCPFEGRVDLGQVESVARELIDMGCYEVSLGDTIGVGTPTGWERLVDRLRGSIGVERLAVHAHDTYGGGVANVLAAVRAGVRTVDSSVAGLGGCPYSPGATGNVATEDVLYALESSGYATGVLPAPAAEGEPVDDLLEDGPRAQAFRSLALVGEWISGELGRPNASRAGPAAIKRWQRRQQDKINKAKL